MLDNLAQGSRHRGFAMGNNGLEASCRKEVEVGRMRRGGIGVDRESSRDWRD